MHAKFWRGPTAVSKKVSFKFISRFLCNVCNAIIYNPRRPRRKNVYNFATTKLVLLPGLELGSKSLLPTKK